MTGVLTREERKQKDAERGQPREGGGRGGRDVATAKELLGPPEVVRDKEVPPLEASEGARPGHTLILDFWPPELGENKGPIVFSSQSLWYFVTISISQACLVLIETNIRHHIT